MKFNLKNLSNITSSLPDILAKGKQAVEAVQTISSSLKKGEDKKTEQLPEQHPVETAEVETAEVVEEQDDKAIVKENLEMLCSGPDVVSAISRMVEQANETIKFCEQQETIRTEIRANAAVEIKKINTTANLIRDYLNRSFDERAGLFDNYFTIVDKALETGDNTLLAQTLQSINSLASSSPFKDLADINKVSSMLSEGGEWDI
ncbi:MAG: hypothetical protein HDS88_00795 [Bacteroidales bacterium]|nr:hypothetical protein [Bacteroidales bacterium]